MPKSDLARVEYQNVHLRASWSGVCMDECSAFRAFLAGDVAERLNDEDGYSEFKEHLIGLATTGFEQERVNEILSARVPEERDWAVGEALAEAYLAQHCNVTWPWNMERDKKNPHASLAGADLVGFYREGKTVRLALGEVKTSRDPNSPPGVMNGRSGMAHQLDRLAVKLSLIYQLLSWLWFRCKGTEHQALCDVAIKRLMKSKCLDVELFGVLIRDTQPNEKDLRSRGLKLGAAISEPTNCQLIAVYLPCKISDLPAAIPESSL